MGDLVELEVRTIGGLPIAPVSERPLTINALIYGRPGVGKTVLAGSAAAVDEMGPVLFIDIEGGTLSVRSRYPTVEVVRVDSWMSMQKVYDQLRREKGGGFKTVVIDSLTEAQKFSMNEIMRTVTNANPDRDPDIPGIKDWGKSIEQIRKMVRLFRDLPVHTIFTAHEATDKDERTGAVLVHPSLPGKLANEVAGFVDMVLYMYKKAVDGTVTRLLLTDGTDTRIAKDRSDALPAVIQDPTMQTIYDYVFRT